MDAFGYALVVQCSINNLYFWKEYFRKMAIEKTLLIDVLDCS